MKTTTKPVTKTKTATKAVAKTQASPVKAMPTPTHAVKAKTSYWYAALLARSLKGEFGPLISRYYKSAIQNHTKLGTVFPRPRNATEGLMKPEAAETWLKGHTLTSIPSGNKCGQRLFDEMMVQAKQMPQPKSAAKAA